MREDKQIQLRNKSVFAPYFSDFVAQKRALGNRYDTCVEVLNLFDDFCIQHEVREAAISDTLFQEWCQRRTTENGTTQKIRVAYTQMFSKFLHDNGIEAPASFHPLPKQEKAFIPYIFSTDEIRRLIDTIDGQNSTPCPGAPARHLVQPVLFRVLYGCGLRVNEALKLKKDDADLENGTLLIREAKGGRDRIVVMSDGLTDICRTYRSNHIMQSYESEYFFPNRDHGYYDASTIYADFRKYLLLSGIPHRGRGKGPRLHDVRHSFSVHVLSTWVRQGKDLYTCLPILQTYLGHTRLSATEKYLRLVPEAFTQVTEAFESEFGTVFPEVRHEEK